MSRILHVASRTRLAASIPSQTTRTRHDPTELLPDVKLNAQLTLNTIPRNINITLTDSISPINSVFLCIM